MRYFSSTGSWTLSFPFTIRQLKLLTGLSFFSVLRGARTQKSGMTVFPREGARRRHAKPYLGHRDLELILVAALVPYHGFFCNSIQLREAKVSHWRFRFRFRNRYFLRGVGT